MGLTKLSLRRPVSTLLLVLALFVFGFTALTSLRLELIPDMDMPILMVMTVYPGADPETVDEVVSKKIEGDVGNLSGVDTISSYSRENASIVLLQYDYSVDTDEAYLDLRAALDLTAHQLPDDCQDPVVIEMNVNSLPSITYSISTTDNSNVLSVVNDDIVPELEAISTVASVDVSGGREHYVRVTLNESALNQYGLTLQAVSTAIATADYTIPLGSMDQGTQSVSAIAQNKSITVDDLRKIPLMSSQGAMLCLSDVAEVSWDNKEANSISRFNGEETVTISVTKNQSASTVGVTRDVKKKIDRLCEQNPYIVAECTYDATDLIFMSLGSVARTLVLGIILSMIILFIFFGDWKASLIVGCSMPISLLVTIIVMAVAGFSLNIITLGALVIAIGMMVDSSSVVLESCFRASDKYNDYNEAAQRGTGSVVGSIIASTITTVVVYVPLCIQDGLVGQIFGQLGYTIVFAMLASLISAITLVPLFYVMYKPKEKKELKINRLLDKINSTYDVKERKLFRHKALCVIVAVVLLIASFGIASIMDTELMPDMDQGQVSVSATLRPGTLVANVDEAMSEIEQMIATDENVDNYTITINKGSASITANLKEDRELSSKEVADVWTQKTSNIAGITLNIAPASMFSSLGSGTSGASVTLTSTDLDDLKEAIEKTTEATWELDHVLNVSSSTGDTTTQIKVNIDAQKIIAKGLTSMQLAGGMYQMISGSKAGTIYSDGKEYDITVEYPKSSISDASSILDMSVFGVNLRDVASLEYTNSAKTIQRSKGKYTATVTATCLSDFASELEDNMENAVDEIKLPGSVKREDNQMAEMMSESFIKLFQAIAVATFLVFLVMAMQFESPKYSLMVMASIPFSLIGSFGLLFISGQAISITSLMGILMLVGIVVNNGILYVDGVNELRGEGLEIEDALIESGKTRLRPILITTLTTIISMIPMSMGMGTGTEMIQAMGTIIIGGLITSTVLILILMPVLYLMLYSDKKKKTKKNKKAKTKKQPVVE